MTQEKNTIRLSSTDRGLRVARHLLSQGGLVAFPTETVYGLGADASNDKAVASIYAAKGRPSFNPLIIHVASLEVARTLAKFSNEAEALAAAFWPGPLTLILPRPENSPISSLASGGLDTIAIRVPTHPLAQKLLEAFDGPIAAPSANPSGQISASHADHVMENLSGRIDAVLDGGACPVGLESTILDLTGSSPILARPGGLASEPLEATIGVGLAKHGAAISAPGQLASHYAPTAQLLPAPKLTDAHALWLAFGPLGQRQGLSLSEASDLTEAAANLFSHLHALDRRATEEGQTRIFHDPVPETGLGLAINDRLRRAAAERPDNA